MREPLPIDEHVDSIVTTLRREGALVLVSPPGSGKTTRVPPALVDDGPVLLLQPRRIATRALARRIAGERDWTIGDEVGWQIRHERRFGSRTRLLVATEGVLSARLRGDPLLSTFTTVVLDEFHERSIHGDLGLALVRQAAAARGDMRILVMSATLDPEPIARYLGGCPVIDLPGRSYPVKVEHAAGLSLERVARAAFDRSTGHLLCFLEGAPEIRRAMSSVVAALPPGTRVLPLHGSLTVTEQERALAPAPDRKVILATNIAETSLTVEGVTEVVDGGWHKVARRDRARGIDRLERERIPLDAADQRAGRAGRTGPGRATRLWDEREQLLAQREPEVLRVDLARPLLEIAAWGDAPRDFEWFEPPPAESIEEGLDLLRRLGALDGATVTNRGRAMLRFPLHPRLAGVMLDCGAPAAAACAALAEGRATQRVQRTERELRRLAGDRQAPGDADAALRRALLAAYPERAARRRSPGSPRLLLANGHGAALTDEDTAPDAEWLVALDLVAGARGPGSEARVRSAAAIEREWLAPTAEEDRHELDSESRVRAIRRTMHGALTLDEQVVTPDRELARPLLVDAALSAGLGEDDRRWLRRASFAGVELDVRATLLAALAGDERVRDVRLEPALPFQTRRTIERLAPERWTAPSGRAHRLDYREDGRVAVAVKLQEMFGVAESPRIGPRDEPLTMELLAPNGRPVQTTRDLRSFWNTTYAEVRKELRGRYPKHPWPEDPWTAEPTARPKRRR